MEGLLNGDVEWWLAAGDRTPNGQGRARSCAADREAAARIALERGYAAQFSADNGPEFRSPTLDSWGSSIA